MEPDIGKCRFAVGGLQDFQRVIGANRSSL
jgi:hypothetical protein